MTFLHPRVADLNKQYQRDTITYTFHNGLPSGLTSAATGTGTVTTVGYTDPKGAALKLGHAASPDTAQVLGPMFGRNVAKAAMVELEGISFGGTTLPLFGFGFYPASGFAHYAEVYRDQSIAGKITSQNTSSANRTITNVGTTNDKDGEYDGGLLLDFAKSQVVGHVGHSYGAVTNAAHIPGVDLGLRLRGVTTATYSTFDVYVRKVTLSIWR